MQISDLSGEQQQQLAMQEGATTPEDMIMVLKTLAEDPDNLARALSMMGLNVSREDVQQAAAWMEQSAGASAGMPPESEQAEGEAGAAAGDDATATPPTSDPAATTDEGTDYADSEAADVAAPAMPEEPTPMPPRGTRPPTQPSMDDIVSASVMQGAPGPAPQMRGTPNMGKLKGPAGLKQPRAGAPSSGQEAAIMKMLQSKRAR